MLGLSRRAKIFLFTSAIILVVLVILYFTVYRKQSTNTNIENHDGTVGGMVGKFIYESGVGVVDNYEEDIKSALKTWDNIIEDDIKINISFYSYSSNDDTLAFAFMNDEDDIYDGGVVYINTYNKSDTSMKNIIEHEIGHVLGVGTSKKWDMANNSTVLDKNLFPKAYHFYKSWEKGTPDGNGIPLGSNGYHWSEDVFDLEMMTPYSEKCGLVLPISGLTLNALDDIGWKINLSKADVFPHS